MTQRDFVLIAAVVRNLPRNPSQRQVAEAFAEKLQETNERFKKEVFMAACSA